MRIGPTLRRKRNPKTSHIEWGESGLWSHDEQRLREHMALVHPALRKLFHDNIERLPRKSTLSSGCYGSWTYCPNGIADEACALIARHHAGFV